MWRMMENVKCDLPELHFRKEKQMTQEDLLYQVVECKNGERDFVQHLAVLKLFKL